MTGRHKHGGLLRGMFGGGIKGMLLGGLAVAALGVFGVLAGPALIGAAIVAPILMGATISAKRGVQWGFETVRNVVGGVTGRNREAHEQQQQEPRMGLIEGLFTLVAAKMGFDAAKDKLSHWLSGGDNSQNPGQGQRQNAPGAQQGQAPQQGQGQGMQQSMQPQTPQERTWSMLPRELVGKVKVNEQGQLEISERDLADKEVRKGLKKLGEQQRDARDDMVRSAGAYASVGNRDAVTQIKENINAIDERARAPLTQNENGEHVINIEQLANKKGTVADLISEGREQQKENKKEHKADKKGAKADVKALKKEGKGIRNNAEYAAAPQEPVQGASQTPPPAAPETSHEQAAPPPQPSVAPPAPAQAASPAPAGEAPVPAPAVPGAQQGAPVQPVQTAGKAPSAAAMPQQGPDSRQQAPNGVVFEQRSSGLIVPDSKNIGSAVEAARQLRDSGAKLPDSNIARRPTGGKAPTPDAHVRG